jgi:hypothetical protein
MRIGNLLAGLAIATWSAAVLLLAALGHDGFAGGGAYGLGEVVGFALMALIFLVGARSVRTELRSRGRR